MICIKCLKNIEDDSIFCRFCGTKQAVTCPVCGQELPPDSKFCSKCGIPISAGFGLSPSASALHETEIQPTNDTIEKYTEKNTEKHPQKHTENREGSPEIFVTNVRSGIAYIEKYNGRGGNEILPARSVKHYTGIAENAFSGCTTLTSLTIIPGAVDFISKNAFSGCTGLRKIMLPDGIDIKDGAFDGCPQLTVFYHGRQYDRANMDELYKK